MLSTIPGLHLLNASSALAPRATTENVTRHCHICQGRRGDSHFPWKALVNYFMICCPLILLVFKNMTLGQEWWLTPVILALWEVRWADHLRSGVWDQPDQHSEIPSLLKIQNKLGMVAHASQLLGRLGQENCLNPGDGPCSEPRLCRYTLTWATRVQLCLKKIKVKIKIWPLIRNWQWLQTIFLG